MTQQTFTALFDTYASASAAVTRLEAAGISHEHIGLVSNDAVHQTPVDPHAGTTTGASLGTLIGGGAGLLAGLGMLAIPGLGPVVAAGWLASTLVGAGVGAAAGGIVGALTDAGVSDEDAEAYAEGLQRGGTLVTVRADSAEAATVTGILDQKGTVDLDARNGPWREAGWSGADPAEPARPSAEVPLAVEPPAGAPGLAEPDPTAEPVRPRVRVYDTTI